MKENDVLIFLSKFSLKELKTFSAYLKKQYKPDSIPIRLLQFLKKYYPDFKHKNLNYECTHAFVIPDRIFNKKMILNSLSDLRLIIKKYMLEQHLKSSPVDKEMMMLEVYRKYQMDNHFEKQHRLISTLLEEQGQQDLWFWFNQLKLDHEQYFFVGTQRPLERWSIFNAMKSLDRFHAAAKLKYASEVYNGFNLLNESEPEVRFLDEILDSAEYDDSGYHLFYKKVFLLVSTQSEDLYFELKILFFDKYNTLIRQDQFILITYLLNHTSAEIRRGKDNFINETFELIQFGVTHQLFIVDEVFNPDHFLNAVMVAIKVNEFDWAYAFITNWYKKLTAKKQDYYLKFCRALISFQMGDYKKCSHLLRNMNITESQDQYRGRWLLLIADFENDAGYKHLSHRCDAFEQFIRRNKIINYKIKSAMLLSLKVLRLLLVEQPDKVRLESLLEQGSNFYYKSWLKEKIKAL